MQRQSTETNEKNLGSERDVESLSKHERHLPVDDIENLEIYAEYEGDNAKEGTLHRGIQSRQIGMIALGGAVGTGLVIGSGTALTRGGPLGLFLGYAFIGFVCYLVMASLGEMAAFLPHRKGFAGYAARFVDPAMGFALGWNYLMKYWFVTPNNINAVGIVMQYWTTKVNVAVWMAIVIIAIFGVNLLGVRVFGELEFWLSGVKILALIGMLLMGLIIDLGGNPMHDRIGFRYWEHPYGPMGTYLKSTVKNNSTAIFLGFWSVLTNAMFAYIGTELIGVTVGEAENPRRNIPIAIRRTFWRIVIFYVGGVLVIGMTVPSTSSALLGATKAKTGAAASPFVVAASLVGIKSLGHIINGAILIFVLSAANSDLYTGTRTLYGLAIQGQAPRIFRRVNKAGVPYNALILCTLVCCLVFLNVKSGTGKVFGYFVNLVSAFGAITWMSIAYSHIRFMKALKVHGISRDTLPYKAPFQPWGSWFAIIVVAFITIFKGFDAFMPHFAVDGFLTAYIALPTFAALYGGYKIYYRTRLIPVEEIDLVSGKREIDEQEQAYLAELALHAHEPKSIWAKMWSWV